jgi:hypothetical protein
LGAPHFGQVAGRHLASTSVLHFSHTNTGMATLQAHQRRRQA